MKITMCGSIKFMDEMVALQKTLEKAGHTVYMPIKVPGVDYWEEDGSGRVAAKKADNLIGKHMDKIKKSDAILVANYTKKGIKNYIGGNTFSEMMFAHYLGKKIYMVNPAPKQNYVVDIIDELDSMEPRVVGGSVDELL